MPSYATRLLNVGKITVISLLCILTVDIPCAFGQSTESSPPRDESEFEQQYWIRPDGQMSFDQVGGRPSNATGACLPFLRNKDIQLELEFTDAQKTELDKLFSSINETETEIEELRKSDGSYTSEVRRAIRQHEAAIKQLLIEGQDSLLLPHQEKRLIELRNRFEIRRNGLYAALVQSNISTLLKVTPEQKKQIREVVAELHAELSTEIRQLKDEFIDAISGSLDKEQQEKLNDATSDFQYYRNVFLEIMILQSETDEFDSLDSETRLKHAALSIPYKYKVGPDGRFLLIPKHPIDDMPVYLVASGLLEILRDAELQALFELSENQLVLFEKMHGNPRAWYDETYALLNRDRDHGYINANQIIQAAVQSRERMSEEKIKDIEAALLPFQAVAMDRLVNNIKLVRAGLLYSLTHDSFGEELEVTSSQKRKMADQVAVVAKKIRKRGVEIEQLVETKLSEILDRQQRDQLESLLGEPIQHGDANIDFTIMQLHKEPPRDSRQWVRLYESLDED